MSRLDKFLWSVRIYKTRSDAADACRSGKVKIMNVEAKPSREIKVGEEFEVRKVNVNYKYRVVALTENRLPAKLVPEFIHDLTPEEELAKLNVPKESLFISRDKGSGRPTKKESRLLDDLLDF